MLNLHHNTLKQRPTVDGLDMIGWIEDLTRFAISGSLLPNQCESIKVIKDLWNDI